MPHDIQAGLSQLDLSPLGALFIENLGLRPGPSQCDLGEEAKVVVFSVAAGEDSASKHPQAVEWADAVVLNKLDLAALTGFDIESFRNAIHRLNPRAKLFELSAAKGQGFDDWAAWVCAQIHTEKFLKRG